MKAFDCFESLRILAETKKDNPHRELRQALVLLEFSRQRINKLCPNDYFVSDKDADDLIQQALHEFKVFVEMGIISSNQTIPFKLKFLKRVLQGVFQFPDVYFKDNHFITSLIKILQGKASNTIIKLLIRNLIENWDTLQLSFPEVKAPFLNLTHLYLEKYSGQIELLNFFKSNPNFLTTGGPNLLGAYLAQTHTNSLDNSLQELGIHSTWLQYQYVEHVIFSYYQEITRINPSLSNLNFQELEELCSKTTSQVALVTISLLLKNYKNLELSTKEKLIPLALRILGDPLYDHRWILNEKRFYHYSNVVENAKRTIQIEMNSEVLTFFFQLIAGDQDRKDFWKTYVRKVEQIKIIASQEVKNSLLTHKELREKKELINSRFIEVPFGTTAIAFFLPNRIIIEFSERSNATYVYTQNSSIYQRLSKNMPISNTRFLKNPNIDTLSKRQIYRNEYKQKDFRVIHGGIFGSEWQTFYRKWLKEVLGI